MDFETDTGIHEMDTQTEFKQEPCFLETASIEMKYESEATHGCIKSELPSFASVFIVQSDSEIHQDGHEIDIKIEIKEEPVWLEGSSVELKSESDGDLHFETEGDVSDGDQEFLLPESSRLDTEAEGNYKSGIVGARSDKNCLKRKENSSRCHGTFNTNTAHMDDKMSHKCKFCGRCFNLASGLQMHIVTHDSKRIFKCDKCDKTFTTASSLNAHILIFEAKRQHPCNICDKSFHTAASLKRHNLIHEVERLIQA